MAYKLDLPVKSIVHPRFHVIPLHKHLLREENIIDQDVFVEFIEPPTLIHEPKRIMDSHEIRTRHYICHQVLLKWKDFREGATWENVSTIKKRFPTFVFEDKKFLNFFKGGSNVGTRVLINRATSQGQGTTSKDEADMVRTAKSRVNKSIEKGAPRIV